MYIDKDFPTSSTHQIDDGDSEDEDKRTIFCANLDAKVTDELLCELFIQAGPVESVRIPTDRDGRQRNFGFITYSHSCSVQYALKLFNGIRLFNRILTMRSNNSNQQQQQQQIRPSHHCRIPPPPPNLRKDNSNSKGENSRKSYNNSSALRLGMSSQNSHIRFDSDMQPKKSKTGTNEKQRNPFKVDVDVLSRLSSYLLPPKAQKNANINKLGNSTSPERNRNDEISKHPCRGTREQNKIHPYKRSDKLRHEDRNHNRNLFGNERNKNQRQKRRR